MTGTGESILSDSGIPDLPPASRQLERMLERGSLPSRGLVFVCEDLDRTNLLARAAARAWMCDASPVGCGDCFPCNPDSTLPEYYWEKQMRDWQDRDITAVDAHAIERYLSLYDPRRSVSVMVIHHAVVLTQSAVERIALALDRSEFLPGGLMITSCRRLDELHPALRERSIPFHVEGSAIPSSASDMGWASAQEAAYEEDVLGLSLTRPSLWDRCRDYVEGTECNRFLDDESLRVEPAEDAVRGRDPVWAAGVVIKSAIAVDRANNIWILSIPASERIHKLPVRVPPELHEDKRRLLWSGEICALRLQLEATLERWWGRDIQGRVLEVLPLDKAAGRFGPRTIEPYDPEEI